jgi:hypothetical protein
MIVNNSEESGYMDSCNVCMCSEKHSKLIKSDAVPAKKPILDTDIKAVVDYATFRRSIYFLEKNYSTVNIGVYKGFLSLVVEGEAFSARINLRTVDELSINDMSVHNKYSLEYLKEFCKGFSEKDIDEVQVCISSVGDYPLVINYRGDQWFILAPRVGDE